MKNLHLIPTDKPSRLFIDTIENKLYYQPILHNKTVNVLTQHIYITNDKEIKEGDWCIGMDGIFQYKGKVNIPDFELPKKIILTTDTDLINDGVQAIDDEFLVWFVENPSCESVEVNRDWGYPKIIIPKEKPTEEAKQRAKNYMSLKGALEPKKETLEELIYQAIGLASNEQGILNQALATSNVMKILQERMYSEEDRLKRSDKLWKKLVKELSVLNDNNYAARRLFDYIERHYRQPPQQPQITNN